MIKGKQNVNDFKTDFGPFEVLAAITMITKTLILTKAVRVQFITFTLFIHWPLILTKLNRLSKSFIKTNKIPHSLLQANYAQPAHFDSCLA